MVQFVLCINETNVWDKALRFSKKFNYQTEKNQAAWESNKRQIGLQKKNRICYKMQNKKRRKGMGGEFMNENVINVLNTADK